MHFLLIYQNYLHAYAFAAAAFVPDTFLTRYVHEDFLWCLWKNVEQEESQLDTWSWKSNSPRQNYLLMTDGW